MAGQQYDDLDFINLNDIKSSPDTLPDGDYHLKIVDLEVRKKKSEDSYYANYRTVVQSGEHAGASFFNTWSLAKDHVWRMKRDFIAIGYAPASGIPRKADLLGFEGIALVKTAKGKDGYDDKNIIAQWRGPLA